MTGCTRSSPGYNHKVIWLEPKCAEDHGRLWCQDEVFDACTECGEKPVKYVRADLIPTALLARIEQEEKK